MLNLHQALQNVQAYRKFRIQDLLCVEYTCPDQRDKFEFWMEVGCLVYCTAGKKLYRSSMQDLCVETGSIFFLKKGAYTGKNFVDETYCALMFFLPDQYIREFLLRYDALKSEPQQAGAEVQDGIISLQRESVLETFFFSILQYFSSPIELQKDILRIKLDELLFNLFTHPLHKPIANYLYSLLSDQQAQLHQIMEENYASNMKLEEYAQLCHLSLSSFKRAFTKHYQQSPAKWILNKKLQLATRLLQLTDKPINEISFQCGFESTSHFIRVFKKYTHLTPKQFRALKEPQLIN